MSTAGSSTPVAALVVYALPSGVAILLLLCNMALCARNTRRMSVDQRLTLVW